MDKVQLQTASDDEIDEAFDYSMACYLPTRLSTSQRLMSCFTTT